VGQDIVKQLSDQVGQVTQISDVGSTHQAVFHLNIERLGQCHFRASFPASHQHHRNLPWQKQPSSPRTQSHLPGLGGRRVWNRGIRQGNVSPLKLGAVELAGVERRDTVVSDSKRTPPSQPGTEKRTR
jgi:hypothetical protein